MRGRERGAPLALHSGKLTKNLVRRLGTGRHGDGGGLYLVVDPSGARRWIVRVTVKGQRNREGKPLRTDFGLGGADEVKGLPKVSTKARWKVSAAGPAESPWR